MSSRRTIDRERWLGRGCGCAWAVWLLLAAGLIVLGLFGAMFGASPSIVLVGLAAIPFGISVYLVFLHLTGLRARRYLPTDAIWVVLAVIALVWLVSKLR